MLTNKTPLPGDILEQLPELRYIGVLATGYNIVDVDAARERGIVVTNIPTYGTASVAQFVFALLLELCHNVRLHADAVRAGEWSRNPDWSFWKSPLMELAGKTMGIVGFGRIGRADGAHRRRHGHARDRQRHVSGRRAGVRRASAGRRVEELLRESDVVSLHSPLFPETRGMINARTPRADEADRVPDQHLARTAGGRSGPGRRAERRPPRRRRARRALAWSLRPRDNPLLSARNCLVTPHIAWATREARSRLMDLAVANVAAFLAGAPRNVVS